MATNEALGALSGVAWWATERVLLSIGLYIRASRNINHQHPLVIGVQSVVRGDLAFGRFAAQFVVSLDHLAGVLAADDVCGVHFAFRSVLVVDE